MQINAEAFAMAACATVETTLEWMSRRELAAAWWQRPAILFAMAEPRLKVLGVYRPIISKEAWQNQWAETADDEYTKDYFERLVLIEAIVDDLDEPFNMNKFGQMQPEFPDDPTRMLVGYDEGLLSADGETLIDRDMDCIRGSGQLRFAVYLQYYDPDRSLRWQKGEVTCPPVQEVPLRLMMLMPYTAF
jgi:hypothetical protein